MKRGIAFWFRDMQLLTDNCLQLLTDHCLRPSCSAGPDALVPCVTKICVAHIPALSKPRTAAAATATFSGFVNDAALGTYGTDYRRHNCCVGTCSMIKRTHRKRYESHYIVWAGMHLHPSILHLRLQASTP